MDTNKGTENLGRLLQSVLHEETTHQLNLKKRGNQKEVVNMPRKTIADITVEVLNETDNPGIMFGDCGLLDMVAERCTHTTLMDAHPLDRHTRILNALDDDDERFKKFYIHMNGVIGNPYWRCFELKTVQNKEDQEE